MIVRCTKLWSHDLNQGRLKHCSPWPQCCKSTLGPRSNLSLRPLI